MIAGWPAALLAALGVVVIGAGVTALVQAARFNTHLLTLERGVDQPSNNRVARDDLPPEVAALAARLGARADGGVVTLRQRGRMWSAPGARPMAFEARQTASPHRLAYVWNADMAPGRVVKAADYLVAGSAGLEVRALGLFSIARVVGGAEIERGEALRYLAEIPWNPDAILLNSDLAWTVLDARTLRVAHGDAAVTFVLGDDGLPKAMSAPSRPYMDKDRTRHVPWSGRFGHYRPFAGRLVPTDGEVAWTLDGQDFVYWRGTLRSWSSAPARPVGA